MKYNKISENDRKRVIDAFKNKENWRDTTKTRGINTKTAYKRLFNNQEIPKKRGGKGIINHFIKPMK